MSSRLTREAVVETQPQTAPPTAGWIGCMSRTVTFVDARRPWEHLLHRCCRDRSVDMVIREGAVAASSRVETMGSGDARDGSVALFAHLGRHIQAIDRNNRSASACSLGSTTNPVTLSHELQRLAGIAHVIGFGS